MKELLKALVRGYQIALSPLLGKSKCRFYPCCSQYALQALEVHGALKGIWLTIKRVVRCGPWSEGGYDPVPPLKHKRSKR